MPVFILHGCREIRIQLTTGVEVHFKEHEEVILTRAEYEALPSAYKKFLSWVNWSNDEQVEIRRTLRGLSYDGLLNEESYWKERQAESPPHTPDRWLELRWGIADLVREEIDRRLREKVMGQDAKNEENKDRQLEVAQNVALDLRRKLKAAEDSKFYPDRPDAWDLREIVGGCRRKNGTINYSALGRKLGRCYHTAKKWCREARID